MTPKEPQTRQRDGAPRILLLQARRPGDRARSEERESFARRCDLPLERIEPHDLLSGPPSLHASRSYDAVMIGGSGDFYVSKADLPHQDALFDYLREIVFHGPPLFASCFGFQCMVQALGGEIVFDPDSTEVGTYAVRLTEEGQRNELFSGLPGEFAAQLGRKDRAVRLPAGLLHLATSARCHFQALQVEGRAAWATQFHPELDGRTNRERFLNYLQGYAAHLSVEERQEALERFRDSPQTLGLLRSFLDLVLA